MAESYELATGYISLVASTKGLGSQIAREFTGIGQDSGQSFSEGFYRDSKGRLRDAKGKYAALPRGFDPLGRESGKRFGKGFGGGAKGLIGGIAGLFAADKIMGFFKDANAEARESQKVSAVTAQVIKATGGAAKITAGQVGDLAGAISNKTGVDDEAVQSGANLLLTFKNVRNEVGQGANVFDRATQAAVDLSAAGFGSVESGSKMLGKALNDPVKGISALSRAGVTFTDQQKAQIKTLTESGKTLEAQKIILGEVESQVGGVAAASATSTEKLQTTYGNLKEQIGTALLPAIDSVATTLTEKVLPAVSGFITGMQDGTGAGGRFADKVKAIAETLKDAYAWFKDNKDVIIPLVAAIATGVVVIKTIIGVMRVFTAVQAALNLVMSLNPIGLVVLAIAALVAAVVIAYKKNETFRKVVDKVWAGIKKAVLAVVNWFKKDVPAAFRKGVEGIGRAWDKIKELAKAPIRFVIETVIDKGILGAFRKISELVGFEAGKNVHVSLPPGFHAGGWTGPGSKFQPAGIVHADEYVINKAARQRIERDAPGLLDRLNGYAGGGLVGGSGRFTDLFASRLLAAQRIAGQQFHIFQRGFRPATSYSGTSHQGDAVDLGPTRANIVRALRQVGIAAWDRTGKGNWVPHIHGVPLPGAGQAAGSAVWQAQDYLRGGDGLGGRDNGPKVGALGKLGEFVKAGFASFAAWFKNLVKDPLAKLSSLGGGPFGQMVGGVPRLLVEGMVDRVAKFDSGGVLKPGLTLAYNGTGRDERVLTADQQRAAGVVIHGGVHGFTAAEVAAEIVKRQRRQDLLRSAAFAA